MTTFLFWNLGGKPLETQVARLAVRHQVDVVMLAECVKSNRILLELRKGSRAYRYVKQIGCSKITMFTRFPTSFIPPLAEEDRVTIRNLKLPGLTDILLGVVHLQAK